MNCPNHTPVAAGQVSRLDQLRHIANNYEHDCVVALPVATVQALVAIVGTAKAVVEHWEDGDLAGAVRNLGGALGDLK